MGLGADARQARTPPASRWVLWEGAETYLEGGEESGF